MKEVSREQGFQLMSVLANNADWSEVPADAAQRIINDPVGSGREFTRFLLNGGRVAAVQPGIIPINRSITFDPVSLLGEGWSIEEEDERSLTLTELDLSKVRLVTCLRKGEKRIKGEEKLKRLKEANHVRLDAKVFQTLWENKSRIPENWKEKVNGNTQFIFFDGTILRSPNGRRYALYLYWCDGGWDWNYVWLEFDWFASYPSAVLAS